MTPMWRPHISQACPFVRIPKPVLLFLILIDCILYSISSVLFFLGLAERPCPLSWSIGRDVLVLDQYGIETLQASPSPIKSQLPVMEFAVMLRSMPGKEEEEEVTCAVCLGNLEGRDEVRQLGNCDHVFHKNCIDKWVDLGQLSCPLCRSPLLPLKERGEKRWFSLGFLTKTWSRCRTVRYGTFRL